MNYPATFYTVSVLTIGGLILHLAMELSLHWNPQFYLNPVPFHLTFASAYILGLNGKFTLNVWIKKLVFQMLLNVTYLKGVVI